MTLPKLTLSAIAGLLLSLPAAADILGVSHQDFSTTAQGTAGWSYGYYIGTNSTSGAFSTAAMTNNPTSWNGDQNDFTPGHSYLDIHPGSQGAGIYGPRSAAVRRYTVGANGEPSYTGAVRVVGRLFDINTGDTSVFVAVDADGDGIGAPRNLVLPAITSPATPEIEEPGVEPVRGTAGLAVPFDLTLNVAPGTTIDFGALAGDTGYSDSTGLVAWIVTGDTAVPTHSVANSYSSTITGFSAPGMDNRSIAFVLATDGFIGGSDEASFDTTPGTGFPYQHAGLLYLETTGSGKATRFDSVRIDVTTGADFSDTPRLYILRHNSDPNSNNPAADDRYVRLPVGPVRATNSVGQPFYTFDLAALGAAERTGYGFAVVGSGKGSSGSIAVSEISAAATRVSDAGVIAPQPFSLGHDGKSYSLTRLRGTWEEAEADAIAVGGHLVTINDAAEQAWLLQQFGGEEFYIGLKQDAPGASEPAIGWRWRTNDVPVLVPGNSTPYSNWLILSPTDQQPNNAYGPGEDYAIMNVPGEALGKWGDTRNFGYPETGNYRGIVERDTPAAANNFLIPELSGKANIFDAGLATATQGGVLPPSIDLTIAGGNIITFPQIVGLLNTGADVGGPDGPHTAGRSVNLSGVGGISGYLNGNNTPALVGVFLGASQPAQQPARIDFSAAAMGEDFTAIGPKLGQVFFIGDGLTRDGVLQQFIAPPGATRLFIGFPDGYDGTVYQGVPNSYADNSGTTSVRATVIASAAPIITSTAFPGVGGELKASGGTEPYSWQVFSGNFPAHLTLNPDGTIGLSGQPRVNGTYNFTVRVTDGSDLHISSDEQFTIVIADPVPPAKGIVAWWPGENAVSDVIGNRHGSLKNGAPYAAGSVGNAPEFSAGKVGRAFKFDGTNDYLEVADHDSLDLTGDLTIEAWVNATATGGERTIVSKRSADNNDVTFVFFLRDGIPHFASRNAGATFDEVSSGAAVPAGWSHVAVTLTGPTLRFFINGAKVHEQNFAATRPANSGPLTIGAGVTVDFPSATPAGPFAGSIDELTIYNRGLADAELAAIHAAGAAGKQRDDAARAFSLTANPNGVWSYLEISSGASLPNYNPAGATLLPTPSAGALGGRIDFWAGQASIGHNSTDESVVVPSGGSQYEWLPRAQGWGPGPSALPVLRWTAPAAGRYAVSANFTNVDTTPSSTTVHMRHGTKVLFDDTVSAYRGDGLSQTVIISAAARDTVDFILGTNGDWHYDSAQIAASVVSLGSLPEIEQTQFPEDTRQSGHAWELTAKGGTTPYTFAVISGTLPAGIALEPDGDITGELTTVGRTTFTVEVTDGAGLKSQRTFTVVLAQEIASPSGIAAWFPGELHPDDVVAGKTGVATGAGAAGPYGAGKSGLGFVFDGVNDSVEVAPTSVLNQVPLTIEAWIKPEVRSDGVAADFFPTNVISGDQPNFGGHGIGVNVFPDGSHLWIETLNDVNVFRHVPGDYFAAGQWAHVALVLTPGNAKTYVNGALVDDFSYTQTAMPSQQKFRIGRHNEDSGYGAKRFFKGAIDEVSIYSRALGVAEIVSIVNADALGKYRDDAARDFFSDSNAAGQLWQYGQMGTGLAPETGTFARYPTVDSENALRFWRNGTAPDPNVIKNRGDQPYLHWRAGELSVHPGPGPERIFSAVRWTAPEAGTYAFFSRFSRLNTQSGSASVHLRHNNVSIGGAGDKIILDGTPSETLFGTRFVQAGDTVDFIVGSRDDFGFDATGITPSVVLLERASEPSAIKSLSIQTLSPAVTSGLWHFTATRGPDEAGVTPSLLLQYSATPEVEASWQAVPTVFSSPALINKPAGSNLWLCDPNLSLAPGSYYFRVLTTAPGRATTASAAFGNESLVGGNGEAGPIVVIPVPAPPVVTNLKITTFLPAAAGKKWSFKVAHPNTGGIRLLVQYSLTPDDPASWQYLPGDAALVRPDADGDGQDFWKLDVSRLSIPSGKVFFRIESSSFGAPSSYSVPFGAAAIVGASPGATGGIKVKNPALLTIDAQAKLQVGVNQEDIVSGLVHTGEEIAYIINYRNHGGASASGVTLTVMVPPELELVSATGTTTPIRKFPTDPTSAIIGVKIDVGTVSPSQTYSRRTVIARVRNNAKKAGRGVVNLIGTISVESPDFPYVTANLPFLAIADPLRVGLRVAGTETSFPKGATIPLIFTVENKSPATINNAVASVKIPAGAYVDSYLEDNDTNVERAFDKTGRTSKLTFSFGTMPPNTSRLVLIDLRTPFDIAQNSIFTGDPSNDVAGYTFSGVHAVSGKTLVAIGDGFSVNLTNAIVRPPQIDLGKDVEGIALQGRKTHGIYFKRNAKTPEQLVRGAIVAPGGEATYTLSYRNVGEGAAKNSVIHDDVPRGCTLVPNSLRLNGQPVLIGGVVKLFNADSLPLGPNEPTGKLRDLRNAASLTINVGDLEAGQGGTFTYRVVASTYASGTPTPLPPDTTIGGGSGFMFTDSLVSGVPGNPDDLVLRVVKPYEFRLEYKKQPGFARAGNVLRFGLKYSNAGQLPAYNAFIDLPIPTGTTGSAAFFVEPATATARAPIDGEAFPANFSGATGTQRFELGTLDPGETGEVAIYLRVSSPLNQALADVGEVRILPKINGYQTESTSSFAALSGGRTPASFDPPKLAGAVKVTGTVPLASLSGPKIYVGRIVPISALKGGTMDVTVFFGNSGDAAAIGGNVAMQIPYETTYLSATPVAMTQPVNPADQTNLADTRSTLTSRTETKDGRIERIVVDLPSLPAHSTGCFTFTLKVKEDFHAAAVEDSSCRIVANNLPERVAIPFATQVRSAQWYLAIFESVNASLWSFGGWVASGGKQTVQEEFKDLTINSQFYSCAGLDVFTIRNGAVFAPTGFNRSLVFGPSRMVAAGGGNMVAVGGLNMVAAGGGNAIGVKNIPGFGALNASQLCAAIPRMVAAGAGNLVAAGGGNLVGLDGATLIGNDGSTLIGLDGATLIGNDGSTLIGNDGSTLVGLDGATLIGLDGSTFATIGMDGGKPSFTPVAGAAIKAGFTASNMVAAGGGNMVAAGGGNMVAAGGGNMVAAGGGNMVAAGGGNAVPPRR